MKVREFMEKHDINLRYSSDRLFLRRNAEQPVVSYLVVDDGKECHLSVFILQGLSGQYFGVKNDMRISAAMAMQIIESAETAKEQVPLEVKRKLLLEAV